MTSNQELLRRVEELEQRVKALSELRTTASESAFAAADQKENGLYILRDTATGGRKLVLKDDSQNFSVTLTRV